MIVFAPCAGDPSGVTIGDGSAVVACDTCKRSFSGGALPRHGLLMAPAAAELDAVPHRIEREDRR